MLSNITRFCVLFALLTAGFVAPVGAAETKEEIKKAITAIYENDYLDYPDGEKGVIRSFDVYKQTFKYHAKDYVCIYPDGRKKNVAQLLEDGRMLFASGLQSISSDAEITGIETKGETATVTMKAKFQMEGKRKDGIILALSSNIEARDFWIKEKGKWVVKRSRVLRMSEPTPVQ